METESCSLSLQSFLPIERWLAVASTLPVSLKGAMVLTLDVGCPETCQEATKHVTFRWKPLLPETAVAAEIAQWSPEGAGKEHLLAGGIFSHLSTRRHTPMVLGTPATRLFI